ncbi:MAG: tetraacyldisaccharide 4'-kinase [Alcanivorax sp.]|jgi:tetraacyldisaccharide 4'-kinase|uniref:tetraacyldisaccharide 4'-kinase n=1 Tax=Alcanivorax TaxID=59753 RepID=UPI000C5EDCBA|nr:MULTISPECIES: tetraacyldisaccharide 4'-kinase [Alcanivorax]MAC13080.1 tetraacyldisaccharide 4'-kinase [Alcanivorax sp.]MBG33969.1 tetraacyldisaccharide 4'-kinase [Alcanivorax sp.]MDF1638590.1 tetraacyldisaccharide 4'-kinase [Alcanivorax jadensis]|tara:strand:+ start:4455 stop:5444 length:990 start_codon:yes stop_codon:yes gene_type:complete
MGSLSEWIQQGWYKGSPWLVPLRPLSMLVSLEAKRRLQRFRKEKPSPPVPVLVVGNITVGGTGKTPLVIALVQAAVARGLKVVVVSRGFGGKIDHYPHLVTADSNALEVGDEPVLIARRTGVPVILDPDRRNALDVAIRDHTPDLVISDDGLQHYALPRSAEIVVVDGQRGLGNGRCLPEGPLREPATRLKEVDFVVSTGGGWSGAHPMIMRPADITSLATGETLDHQAFLREHPQVHAVAGIGNPKRFFNLLSILGLSATPHVFPDHHAFQPADLAFADGLPVLMTEKDAVKCAPFAEPHWWYLPVTASLPEGLLEQMLDRALGTSPE